MKTKKDIISEKYADDRNLVAYGPSLMDHAVEEAMEEYAQHRVEEATRLIPVSERLPEVDKFVLFNCPRYCESEFQVAFIDSKLRVWNDSGDELTAYAASWQHLPKAPTV